MEQNFLLFVVDLLALIEALIFPAVHGCEKSSIVENVDGFLEAAFLYLILLELPVIVSDRVKSYLVVVLSDENGQPFREVLLIVDVFSPDVEDVLAPLDIVQVIHIFRNFGDNVLHLGLIILPFLLLFTHIFALHLGDIDFAFLEPFYLFLLSLLNLDFLLDHHLFLLFILLGL